MEFLCFLGGNGKKSVHLSNPNLEANPVFLVSSHQYSLKRY